LYTRLASPHAGLSNYRPHPVEKCNGEVQRENTPGLGSVDARQGRLFPSVLPEARELVDCRYEFRTKKRERTQRWRGCCIVALISHGSPVPQGKASPSWPRGADESSPREWGGRVLVLCRAACLPFVVVVIQSEYPIKRSEGQAAPPMYSATLHNLFKCLPGEL